MANISDILLLENDSQGKINLFLEGIFWKAYQQSAYKILQNYPKKLKVSKKFIKVVKEEVVSVGFPESSLDKIFAPESIEKISEKHICVNCPPFDAEDYQKWFDAQPLSVSTHAEESDNNNIVAGHNSLTLSGENILRKLREFRIEDSSPIECMCFLVSLRKQLEE
jgi:hypothetical protein